MNPVETPRRPVVREAARVLLVDPERRVLLLRGHDPGGDEQGEWWITPGGGIEPGEDARAAAIREVLEETGLRLTGLEGPIARRTSVFPYDGRLLEQHDRFFLARVPAFEPDRSGWTEVERRALGEHRWWSVEALRETAETVYPEGLADLLEASARNP